MPWFWVSQFFQFFSVSLETAFIAEEDTWLFVVCVGGGVLVFVDPCVQLFM